MVDEDGPILDIDGRELFPTMRINPVAIHLLSLLISCRSPYWRASWRTVSNMAGAVGRRGHGRVNDGLLELERERWIDVEWRPNRAPIIFLGKVRTLRAITDWYEINRVPSFNETFNFYEWKRETARKRKRASRARELSV